MIVFVFSVSVGSVVGRECTVELVPSHPVEATMFTGLFNSWSSNMSRSTAMFPLPQQESTLAVRRAQMERISLAMSLRATELRTWVVRQRSDVVTCLNVARIQRADVQSLCDEENNAWCVCHPMK